MQIHEILWPCDWDDFQAKFILSGKFMEVDDLELWEPCFLHQFIYLQVAIIIKNGFYFVTDLKLCKRHFFAGMNLLPFEKRLLGVVNPTYLSTEISVAPCKILNFLKEKQWEKIQKISKTAAYVLRKDYGRYLCNIIDKYNKLWILLFSNATLFYQIRKK